MRYPHSDIYAQKTRPRRFSMPISDPSQMARDWMGQAAGTYGRMQSGQTTETKGPGPTAGGATMGAASGATAGALGSMALGAKMGSVGSYWGMGIGTVLGLGTYLFS